MKLIFSFNGHDNVGKTTQARKLSENNGGLVRIVDDLSAYDQFPKLSGEELFQWWFHDSSPDEFCETLYGCVASQQEDVARYDSPILIIDKGLPTIDARIAATLKVKGLSSQKAEELQVSIRDKLKIISRGINLFLHTDSSAEEQVTTALSRSEETLGDQEERTYANYELEQTRKLHDMFRTGRFVSVNADGTINQVYQRVLNAISDKMVEAVPNTKARVIGLSGMSECGKSFAGKYLSRRHGIWNLKLKYFVEGIAKRYDLGGSGALVGAEDEIVAPLVAEGIVAFLQSHYYRDTVSVESLHGDRFTQSLVNVLKGNMDVVYIDTPLELRIQRTISETGEDVSRVTSDVLEKDQAKRRKGTEKVKSLANVVIDNSGSVLDFQRNLDAVVFRKWEYTEPLFEVDSAQIPIEYKKIIRDVKEELSSEFGESLVLFLVGGSCGRGNVHSGWSDIDLIIGLEEYNTAQREVIAKAVFGRNIKVGTTVYSRQELEAGFVDPKTVATLYYMQNGEFTPTVYKPGLKLPQFPREEVARRDYTVLTDKVHALRRLLYANPEDLDVQTVLRTTNAIMKISLFTLGYDVSCYAQSCDLFAEHYGVREFDPSPFLNGHGNKRDLSEYASEVLGAVL